MFNFGPRELAPSAVAYHSGRGSRCLVQRLCPPGPLAQAAAGRGQGPGGRLGEHRPGRRARGRENQCPLQGRDEGPRPHRPALLRGGQVGRKVFRIEETEENEDHDYT